jgi:hypothetical protein
MIWIIIKTTISNEKPSSDRLWVIGKWQEYSTSFQAENQGLFLENKK